jgi:hypothetical protein
MAFLLICKFFDNAKFVVFYFDPDLNVIGIQPAKQETLESYPLRKQKTGGYVVSGRTFLRFFGIERKKAERYEPGWNSKEKLVEVKLHS